MGSHRKMFLNYFQFHWDFIDYNGNACIYCFGILILSYSDFTFDNVNFDLRKHSGLKYILQDLNVMRDGCQIANQIAVFFDQQYF